MAKVQEEALWLCEAAHVPVVWATQMLESLAQKGLPSRAEINDAAMAEREDRPPHLRWGLRSRKRRTSRSKSRESPPRT